VRGYADHLPVDDGSQRHVVSSFALHHVPTEQKVALAAEISRVLAPGGRVTVVDMAPDSAQFGKRPRAYLADNADHGIEQLLSAAGLVGTAQVDRTGRMGADVVVVQAAKP
jgi:ubiquinone/menaquinone biosynthesis C-methylase UbiE